MAWCCCLNRGLIDCRARKLNLHWIVSRVSSNKRFAHQIDKNTGNEEESRECSAGL
jgi:hypothetical protein